MKVFVCSRTAVSKMTSKVGATHVLSLLDPGIRPFLHPKTDKNNWLLLHFEDNINECELNGPTRNDVKHILEWSKMIPADSTLLVHCEAGVSRSTAAALAILVQYNGIDKLDQCILDLLAVRPQACPNPLITKWADDELKCNGKLHNAAEKIAYNKLNQLFKGLI